MFMPACYKTALIRTRPTAHTLVVTHTHTHPWCLNRDFIFWSQKCLFLLQLTQWESVVVCWLGNCSGVITFPRLRPLKRPQSQSIQGQQKKSTSWVNSTRDTERRGLRGCQPTVSSFRSMGVQSTVQRYWGRVYPPMCSHSLSPLSTRYNIWKK